MWLFTIYVRVHNAQKYSRMKPHICAAILREKSETEIMRL